jgi:hypothetical protein
VKRICPLRMDGQAVHVKAGSCEARSAKRAPRIRDSARFLGFGRKKGKGIGRGKREEEDGWSSKDTDYLLCLCHHLLLVNNDATTQPCNLTVVCWDSTFKDLLRSDDDDDDVMGRAMAGGRTEGGGGGTNERTNERTNQQIARPFPSLGMPQPNPSFPIPSHPFLPPLSLHFSSCPSSFSHAMECSAVPCSAPGKATHPIAHSPSLPKSKSPGPCSCSCSSSSRSSSSREEKPKPLACEWMARIVWTVDGIVSQERTENQEPRKPGSRAATATAKTSSP